MPELPDVEVYRRYLNATSLHQPIDHVRVKAPAILHGISPQGLGRALKHKSLVSTKRHGKNLFIAVKDNGWLLMHFGMTGDLKYFQHRRDTPDYTQLLISFKNGYHLAYTAPRKLGRIALLDTPQSIISNHGLGPDALRLSEKQFLEQATGRRGNIKSWLMDQQSIAGIGNIYSDEILFQAGIHPRRAINELDKTTLKRLYKKIRPVLQAAIKAHASPDRLPAGYLLPHRKKGGRCPKCHAKLATAKSAGRTAWYCPGCQRL